MSQDELEADVWDGESPLHLLLRSLIRQALESKRPVSQRYLLRAFDVKLTLKVGLILKEDAVARAEPPSSNSRLDSAAPMMPR
jgi:hypothetical protein